MANLVKVQRDGNIKSVEESILPVYLSNGWSIYEATKSVSETPKNSKD